MEIPFALIQFGGSLLAILAIAGLAIWLGLGRDARLANDADARDWASQVEQGFVPEMVTIGADGKAALLRDKASQIMLLKQHGGHFVGRILGPNSRAEKSGELLSVDSGESRFGTVALDIEASEDWAKAINALKTDAHA